MRVMETGFVERLTNGFYRDWWFCHFDGRGNPIIQLGKQYIYMPKKYLGKRIKLKIEVLE